MVRTALIRGAFEYQGQKCSAASRAYIASSVWDKMGDDLVSEVEALGVGDVTDFSNFMGAVIDARAFDKHRTAIQRAIDSPTLDVIAGGKVDDAVGYFVRPTVVVAEDPTDEIFDNEYFGPILAVLVYDDDDFEAAVHQMESFSKYALTGAVIAQDRKAVAWAMERLRYAAGNFYINDKPTGAVVGQQPFGVPERQDQRQGRLGAEPAPLDVTALDQGDVHATHGLPLPPHGLNHLSASLSSTYARR